MFLAGQPGAAALSYPARGDMDWTKLTKRHPDRPGGSAGMIAGDAAKQRLAGEAPGTWTLDPKLGHPWLKWPDGEVHWVPRDAALPTSAFVEYARSEPTAEVASIGDMVVSVEWGYELHAITVAAETWAGILAGDDVVLDGDFYAYDGETFQTEWRFGGGMAGKLEVLYRPTGEDDFGEGVGFVGRLKDADIRPAG